MNWEQFPKLTIQDAQASTKIASLVANYKVVMSRSIPGFVIGPVQLPSLCPNTHHLPLNLSILSCKPTPISITHGDRKLKSLSPVLPFWNP